MSRPLIGIPTQTLQAIDGIPAGLPHSWVMNSRYYVAVADAGGAPVMIPLFSRDPDALRAVYDGMDGILLAGGVDMDPCTFGEPPHPNLGRIDRDRDAVELQLARWALEDRKPILGLCRGHQVLNVALGGRCGRTSRPRSRRRSSMTTSRLRVMRGTFWPTRSPSSRVPPRARVGQRVIRVNSMHHQGVKALAGRLVAAGRSPDGLVEAFESGTDHFLIGVQWHPEMFERNDQGTRRLFQEFIAASLRA